MGVKKIQFILLSEPSDSFLLSRFSRTHLSNCVVVCQFVRLDKIEVSHAHKVTFTFTSSIHEL